MKRSLALACLFALAGTHASATDVTFTLTEAKGTPVVDAVVSLIPLDAPAKLNPRAEPFEIAQSNQEFSAFVTPLVVGSTVIFPNADKVSHQVYSLSPTKKFALPLYKPGNSGTVVFDRPGVVAVGCNIHDWMLAYIVVLETPLFAKTHDDGRATVLNVPAGRYRAVVWHARLANNESRELTVSDISSPPTAGGVASATQTFTLALRPDRRLRRAVDAGGGGYK